MGFEYKVQYKLPSAEIRQFLQPKTIIKNMRKIFLFWTVLLLLLNHASTYAIQGLWKLTDVQEMHLPDNHPARIQIKDFVYRNSSVRWAITKLGCLAFKCMADVQGNNIFVDVDTFYSDVEKNQNCSLELQLPQKRFQTLLKKVFTFQIISNFMVFSDPDGQVLFKFQRFLNSSKPDLKGSWMTNKIKSSSTSQMFEINQDKIITCQKQAEIGYKIVSGNRLEFNNQNSSQCTNADLVGLFKGPLYFVKRANGLELYSENDDLVTTLSFVMDLNSLKKLKEEQQKEKDRMPPPPPPLPPLPPVLFNPVPQPQSQPSISYSMSDLMGKWTITKVLSGPSIVNNMVFIIAKDSILISGDCNTFSYSFSLLSPNPIRLKRQNFRQTQNRCANDDEQIYKTALTKVSVLKTETLPDKIVIRAQDDKGTQLLELQKPIEVRAMGPPPPPPPQLFPFSPFAPSGPPPPPPEFQSARSQNTIPDGKYTILLLMRRDIPRKIVVIQNYSFTLKICNDLRISLSVAGQSLKANVEVKSANNCDMGQQKEFINYLNKARSFVKDQLDFILKDQDGKEIITLNFVG